MSGGGFIYVFSNDAFPTLFKIGQTVKCPDARASQLYTTGVPHRFELIFCYFIESGLGRVEAGIHMRLAERRANEGREFFRFDDKGECIESVLSAIVALTTDCEIVQQDFAIPKEDFARVVEYANVHPASVAKMLSFFTKAELEAAGRRHAEMVAYRMELLKQEVCRLGLLGLKLQEHREVCDECN